MRIGLRLAHYGASLCSPVKCYSKGIACDKYAFIVCMLVTSVCDRCTDEGPPPDRWAFFDDPDESSFITDAEARRIAHASLIRDLVDVVDNFTEDNQPQPTTSPGSPGTYEFYMQRLHDKIYPGAQLTLLQVGQLTGEGLFIADVMMLNQRPETWWLSWV
jgi:hypothetical protein